ncbi:MAG: hypothetical protein HYV52_01115 [Parcubacteria group bacterium]|nr:hypothetical protein [Parcubacteria group bacterium]
MREKFGQPQNHEELKKRKEIEIDTETGLMMTEEEKEEKKKAGREGTEIWREQK